MFSDTQILFDMTLLVGILVVLFFVSRASIQSLYIIFHRLFRSDFIASGLIAIIFFPGTVIHELSHFLMAVFLFLPVHKLSLFPQRQGSSLRLGYVLYEKKDVIRGIVVGIAPVIVGIAILWWFYQIDFFAPGTWSITLLKMYVMFVLTSTMFSSKQDMIDIGYLVPVILLAGLCVYLFDINVLNILSNKSFVEALSNFMYPVTIYSSISLGIHVFIYIICTLFIRLLHIQQ